MSLRRLSATVHVPPLGKPLRERELRFESGVRFLSVIHHLCKENDFWSRYHRLIRRALLCVSRDLVDERFQGNDGEYDADECRQLTTLTWGGFDFPSSFDRDSKEFARFKVREAAGDLIL